MTYLSYILRNAVTRLTDAPQRTLSRVTARFAPRVGAPAKANSHPPPDHVTTRLEGVFEALSELSFQPHVAAALELACDALQAELPTEAVAAGLHDIDANEIRFVTARGVGEASLRGTAMPRARCLVGYAAEQAIIIPGATEGIDWIGGNGPESTVLLCPILHDTHLLGLLALADPLCSAGFGPYDLEVVRYVADQLAGFIHEHRAAYASAPRASQG